jgi:large subunit ribosomal protein L15
MQLNQLRPNHKNKKPKRIGRGGKKGSTSGKGSKGQSSRAGRRFEPLIRQFIKKYPKLRGYRVQVVPKNLISVNLDRIDKSFTEKEVVNPVTLLKKRVIIPLGKKIPQVKILGQGEITKSLVFQNCLFSESARGKIEKAKGVIK